MTPTLYHKIEIVSRLMKATVCYRGLLIFTCHCSYVVLDTRATKLQDVKVGFEKNMRHFGFEATFFAGLYSESLLLERPWFESLSAPNLKACNCKDLGCTGPKNYFFLKDLIFIY